MRRVTTNWETKEKMWVSPMKLPRTVRGQLRLLNDLHVRICLDMTDKDHELYDPEAGFGRNSKITKHQITKWFQECMEKNERGKKSGKRPSWRNLWLIESPVYLWFMQRKAWFYICLDCGRGMEGKYLRRKEMASAMAARQPGKWLTAPGTCRKCATEMRENEEN